MRHTTSVRLVNHANDQVFSHCTAAVMEDGELDVLTEDQGVLAAFADGDWVSFTVTAEED